MDFLTAATSSFRLRSADTVFRRKSVREQSPSDTPITPDAKENPSEDATRPKLITYDQLPEWCEGNAFIPTGYRAAPADSTAACLHSLMYLHNETCNIYSHLIPAIFAASFAGLIAYRHGLFSDLRERNAQAIDVGMLALHLATMAMCFALSACFHTMLCHSKTVSRRWLRGDYAGIVGLMWGSFLPGIYFGFFDEEETIWRWVYWTMISVLCVATITVLVTPYFESLEWRRFRLSLFLCTGASGFAPIVHMVIAHGSEQLVYAGGMYYIVELVMMGIGAIFYEQRMPERLSPGRFDIWGHSHTIFHICVVIGSCVHFAGLLSAFEYRQRTAI